MSGYRRIYAIPNPSYYSASEPILLLGPREILELYGRINGVRNWRKSELNQHMFDWVMKRLGEKGWNNIDRFGDQVIATAI